MKQEWNFETAIEQIEKCEFECQGGPLANSSAWRWLRARLGTPHSSDDGEVERLRNALKLAEQFLDKANALACGKYIGSVQVLADRLAEVRDEASAAIAAQVTK